MPPRKALELEYMARSDGSWPRGYKTCVVVVESFERGAACEVDTAGRSCNCQRSKSNFQRQNTLDCKNQIVGSLLVADSRIRLLQSCGLDEEEEVDRWLDQ